METEERETGRGKTEGRGRRGGEGVSLRGRLRETEKKGEGDQRIVKATIQRAKSLQISSIPKVNCKLVKVRLYLLKKSCSGATFPPQNFPLPAISPPPLLRAI